MPTFSLQIALYATLAEITAPRAKEIAAIGTATYHTLYRRNDTNTNWVLLGGSGLVSLIDIGASSDSAIYTFTNVGGLGAVSIARQAAGIYVITYAAGVVQDNWFGQIMHNTTSGEAFAFKVGVSAFSNTVRVEVFKNLGTSGIDGVVSPVDPFDSILRLGIFAI